MPRPLVNEVELLRWLVLDGMDVLERLNTLPTNNYDRAPLATVKIIGCKLL